MEAFSKSCCLADTETYVGQLHRCKFYNIYCKKCSIIDDVGWGQGRGEGITNCHPSFSTIINIPSVFVWHRYQKKQQIKSSVQIQNNLAPVPYCFVIDWNRFKQRPERAKTDPKAVETIGNGYKRKRTWSVHMHKRSLHVFDYLCCLCARWHVFTNTK